MKISSILGCDYREKKNKILIQKVLRKIKPLSKYPDGKLIELDEIMNVINKITVRYNVSIQWCTIICNKNGVNTFHITIMNDDTYKPIQSIFGGYIYEVYAKALIAMYNMYKTNNLAKRKENNK